MEGQSATYQITDEVMSLYRNVSSIDWGGPDFGILQVTEPQAVWSTTSEEVRVKVPRRRFTHLIGSNGCDLDLHCLRHDRDEASPTDGWRCPSCNHLNQARAGECVACIDWDQIPSSL